MGWRDELTADDVAALVNGVLESKLQVVVNGNHIEPVDQNLNGLSSFISRLSIGGFVVADRKVADGEAYTATAAMKLRAGEVGSSNTTAIKHSSGETLHGGQRSGSYLLAQDFDTNTLLKANKVNSHKGLIEFRKSQALEEIAQVAQSYAENGDRLDGGFVLAAISKITGISPKNLKRELATIAGSPANVEEATKLLDIGNKEKRER